MRTLSRIFFAFLFFQTTFGNTAFAETGGASCGFNITCVKGMVCVGSTGTADDGQCVLMPIVVSLCTVFNWIQDYSTYFMIFAVVALGFAFFLGKISWGMIISVLLGIAVIKGAILITQKTTGVSNNYCSAESMQSSRACTNAAWILDTAKSKIPATADYNTDPTQLCPQSMQCKKQTCTTYNTWGIKYNGSLQHKPTLESVNAERTKNGFPTVASISDAYKLRAGNAIISVTQIATYSDFIPQDAYYIYSEIADIPPSELSESFKLYLNCTPNTPASTKNFLVCRNSCTGSTQTIQSSTATTCAAAGL